MTDPIARLREAVELLSDARESVEFEVQENEQNWGDRLMHKQEPAITLLAKIDTFLSAVGIDGVDDALKRLAERGGDVSDHQCPCCHAAEEIDPQCVVCDGTGRVSVADLAAYRAGERCADEMLATQEGKEWLDITVSCIGRKSP